MNESIKLKLPSANDFFVEEAYKSLRTNVQFCGKDIKVIVITSVNENEGKSIVTLALAQSFAELGKKVLAIDSDMRKSVMAARNSDVKSPNGLSEFLTGLKTLEECTYNVEGLPMDVMFCGPYPPNPVELLGGDSFKALLNECREKYDYIFFDTAPLGQVIDAAVIAEECDGAIIVWGSDKVRYRQAKDLIAQIKRSGCNILGIVLNRWEKASVKSYCKKYYKKYYHHEDK